MGEHKDDDDDGDCGSGGDGEIPIPSSELPDSRCVDFPSPPVADVNSFDVESFFVVEEGLEEEVFSSSSYSPSPSPAYSG